MDLSYIAAECYGYIILTSDQEEYLRQKGTPILGSEEGETRPPLKAIVKELIDTKIPFTPNMIPSMIRNLHTMHEVGIFVGDVHKRQYLNGLMFDFGRSKTVYVLSKPPQTPFLCLGSYPTPYLILRTLMCSL